MKMAFYKFLVHKEGDSVGIATDDLQPHEKVKGKVLEGEEEFEINVLMEIPLGYKISLKDIEEGEEIIEYGEKIGKAIKPIKKGKMVHVHSIKSIIWGGNKDGE